MEFLIGIAAGTFSGFLILKRGERLYLTPRHSSHRIRVARTGTISKSDRNGKVRPRPVGNRRPSSLRPLSPVMMKTPVVAPHPQLVVASCPACGLQAPEKLLAEHFLGSPSHQYATRETQLKSAEPKTLVQESLVADDYNNSVRNLLQILVPPRAFGRRQEQRTLSPLSQFVKTLETR